MTEDSIEGRIMSEGEGRPVRRYRTARSGMMESRDTRKGCGLGDSKSPYEGIGQLPIEDKHFESKCSLLYGD
jgi:hypothetical protein